MIRIKNRKSSLLFCKFSLARELSYYLIKKLILYKNRDKSNVLKSKGHKLQVEKEENDFFFFFRILTWHGHNKMLIHNPNIKRLQVYNTRKCWRQITLLVVLCQMTTVNFQKSFKKICFLSIFFRVLFKRTYKWLQNSQ